MYIYIYVCTYVYIYIHMCVYKYIFALKFLTYKRLPLNKQKDRGIRKHQQFFLS